MVGASSHRIIHVFLGRGAITWIVQRANAGEPVSARAALNAAFCKWKPLLASCLLYGVVVTIGMAGLTIFLRDARLDVSNYRWVRNDVSSVINMALIRSISNVPPDPGSPFTDLYSATRFQLSLQVATYSGAYYKIPSRGMPPQIIAAGVFGVLVLAVAEVLLCLRSAVIMRAADDEARGWLRATVSLAATRFGHIAIWRWVTRIGLAFLMAAFLTLPIALHQGVLVSVLIREVRAYWPYALNSVLYSLAAAIIGMIAFAFNTAFEAQLHAVLVEADPAQTTN